MKLISKIGIGFFLLVVAALGIQSVSQSQTAKGTQLKTEPTSTKVTTNNYNVYALPMPDFLEFAGERVPLENPDIYERMDRELHVNTYWQSNMILLMKRSRKYFPIIEPLLAKYGLPDDFKYLAVAESGLDNERSPAGASGFWQILKGTGKEYGLEINDYVDERYHLELSTKVAAEYLTKSKERFGNWTTACAAYNAGNAGVNNQMKRQDVEDYYDLLLNNETSRYVFRILAFKEIMTHPEKYGFNLNPEDYYAPIPTKKVLINTPVEDFAAFAKEQGVNYKILKIHNPWLRDTYLKNASGKEYIIEIPQPGYYQ